MSVLKQNESVQRLPVPQEEIPISQRDMKLDALQDETVKMVLEIFNGKIIDVKK
ncbi:MAG: hypothetical protein ACPL7B_11295 [Candidatus Poribacteria bacterium]